MQGLQEISWLLQNRPNRGQVTNIKDKPKRKGTRWPGMGYPYHKYEATDPLWKERGKLLSLQQDS